MTIREYISQKLPFFNLKEAQFVDVADDYDINLDAEYSKGMQLTVNTAVVHIIEEQVLAPQLASVNEGGFSMSWNYSDLGKLYMHLCRKYGITPDNDVVSLLGINMIKDASSKW